MEVHIVKNDFAKDYAKEQEIWAAYRAAADTKDMAGVEDARNAHLAFENSLSAKGSNYVTVYRLYKESCERGNHYIDIGDIRDYRNEAALIRALREMGIDTFTFSSGWSSAAESAWAFVQNGCTVEGMVELNGASRNWEDDEFVKVHGYIFSIH